MASVFKRGGKKAKGAWYASWYDHQGKRQTQSTRTTDKATAERIAKKYEADAALRRDGVIDPTLDAIGKESQRSIESHLADYESKMKVAGRDPKYIDATIGYIRAIAKAAGFKTASDIAADPVTLFAEDLQAKGKSARTVQAHLTAIKGFTKWLTTHHKLPRDPLAKVTKPNPKTDRRHERRMLLPEEWQWLRAVTANSGERCGMTGAERAALYATAILTGLRSSELRSVTKGRLYLDAKPPYVTCTAGDTKNGELARQYISPELAAELQAIVATKIGNAPVFKMPHVANVSAMFKRDVRAARSAWLKAAKNAPEERERRDRSNFLIDVNHTGERLDFHALRHTCGAWLSMTGAHPKTVQTIMRHSTITLTMDTYGHLFPGQEAGAVASMREMLTDDTPEELRATGTDNATADTQEGAQRQAQRAGRETVPAGCDGVRIADDEPSATETPKVLPDADLGVIVLEDARIGVLGFEPRLTDSESVVLPLHYTPDLAKFTRPAYVGLTTGSSRVDRPVDEHVPTVLEFDGLATMSRGAGSNGVSPGNEWSRGRDALRLDRAQTRAGTASRL